MLKKDGQHDERRDPLHNLIKYTTMRLRIPGYGAAEVFIDFTEELRHPKTDPMCNIHQSRCTSRRHWRPQNLSLGFFCPGEPHERSPNAPKFEDGSQEETEWQELGAREAARKPTKSVPKLKKHESCFFSPSGKGVCWHSNLKPGEREFVVGSGASMHMISNKDLSDVEMDTLTKSCSPTIVITANGEVQPHEEAIEYVKELDVFLTMKVLDNTSAVARKALR